MYEQSSDRDDGQAGRGEHATGANDSAVSEFQKGLDAGGCAAADQPALAIRQDQPAAVGTGQGDGPADAGSI